MLPRALRRTTASTRRAWPRFRRGTQLGRRGCGSRPRDPSETWNVRISPGVALGAAYPSIASGARANAAQPGVPCFWFSRTTGAGGGEGSCATGGTRTVSRPNEVESIDDRDVSSRPADHDVTHPVSREQPIPARSAPEPIGIGPPLSRSSPARPKTLSSPPRPNSRSAPRVPRIVSPPGVPSSLRRRRSNRASERDQPDGCDPSPCLLQDVSAMERGRRPRSRGAHAAHVPTPKHGLRWNDTRFTTVPPREGRTRTRPRELGGILREHRRSREGFAAFSSERRRDPLASTTWRRVLAPASAATRTGSARTRPGQGEEWRAAGRRSSCSPSTPDDAWAAPENRTVSFWARSSVGLPAAVTSRTYRPGSRLRGSAIRLVKDPFVRTSPRATWMRFPRRNAS